jgi:hypothetical protein
VRPALNCLESIRRMSRTAIAQPSRAEPSDTSQPGVPSTRGENTSIRRPSASSTCTDAAVP